MQMAVLRSDLSFQWQQLVKKVAPLLLVCVSHQWASSSFVCLPLSCVELFSLWTICRVRCLRAREVSLTTEYVARLLSSHDTKGRYPYSRPAKCTKEVFFFLNTQLITTIFGVFYVEQQRTKNLFNGFTLTSLMGWLAPCMFYDCGRAILTDDFSL